MLSIVSFPADNTMAIRTGIDIVSVDRIRRLAEKSGDRFLTRWFSEREIAYCTSKARPAQHFAARVAAKEAVVKVLAPPWEGGILLKEIEVLDARGGPPRLHLSGRALRIAEELGINDLQVSLSHCAEYAVASVVAELGGPPRPMGGAG